MTRMDMGTQVHIRQPAESQAVRTPPCVTGLRLEFVVDRVERWFRADHAVGQFARIRLPANGRDPQQLFTHLIGSRTDLLELDGFLLRIPDGVGR